MAELPELTILQQQMNDTLAGRRIAAVELLQEKCLNMPVADAVAALTGRQIEQVTRRGKWLLLHLDQQQYLLINLGMGADLWHLAPGAVPAAKYQLLVRLDDGSGFSCRFWWFGYIRVLSAEELATHPETSRLGPCPMEITYEAFAAIARAYPRSNVKALILDQTKLSGIGNAYAHDILFTAGLHPLRKLGSLTEAELRAYRDAIRSILQRAIALGGIERDYYGTGGHMNHWETFCIIGYREGQPCPTCGTPIARIKTGATATFICPSCQR